MHNYAWTRHHTFMWNFAENLGVIKEKSENVVKKQKSQNHAYPLLNYTSHRYHVAQLNALTKTKNKEKKKMSIQSTLSIKIFTKIKINSPNP